MIDLKAAHYHQLFYCAMAGSVGMPIYADCPGRDGGPGSRFVQEELLDAGLLRREDGRAQLTPGKGRNALLTRLGW